MDRRRVPLVACPPVVSHEVACPRLRWQIRAWSGMSALKADMFDAAKRWRPVPPVLTLRTKRLRLATLRESVEFRSWNHDAV